jgi:Mor family transcriptional regulator
MKVTGDQHAAIVDDWLERSATDLPAVDLLRLFESALRALWDRTKTTLGEVTLIAIAERVLHDVSEKFPQFSSLKVKPAHGFQCRALGEHLDTMPVSQLRAAMRCVLVDLLTVLGRLTAEILTPELHAELARVVLPNAGGAMDTRAAQRSRRRRKEGI